MPAAGFMARFAPLVITGEKLTTIRAGELWKKGDRFVAFYGLRFLNPAVFLAESTLIQCDPISILEVNTGTDRLTSVWVCGSSIAIPQAGALARGDGFADYAAMIQWFRKTHGLPFRGQLLQWERPDHCDDPEIVAERLTQLRNALREKKERPTRPPRPRRATPPVPEFTFEPGRTSTHCSGWPDHHEATRLQWMRGLLICPKCFASYPPTS